MQRGSVRRLTLTAQSLENSRVRRRDLVPSGCRLFIIVQMSSLVVILALSAACAGSNMKPREACLVLEASPSLNLYDGEAHALNVLIYPLTGASSFREASVDDLVSSRGVEGASGPAISVMMSPGEEREIKETFPPATGFLGVIGNFYQRGLDQPGNRRAVVKGKCSLFGSDKITLTARDLLAE